MKSLLLFIFICLGITISNANTVCPTNLGSDQEACAGESIILNGESPNGSFTYAWFKDNVLIVGEDQPTLVVTESGLYRVELMEGTSGCSDEAQITFGDTLSVMSPTPAIICDNDDDGFATVDLTFKDDEITNGDPVLSVGYYLTQSDATQAVNVLIMPFTNTTQGIQTLFVRVEDSNSGCFAIVTLDLIVIVVAPGTPIDLVVADDDGDGFEVFDLTINDAIILDGLDPSDNQVTYHINAADADNGVNPFAVPSAYTNVSNPQEIFVRLTNISSDCHDITSFSISLGQPSPDQDNDGVPDEDEDLNGNGNLDDDDTDGDLIPNYLDSDDDGDMVETIDEITGIGAGRLLQRIFIDTDNDTIENYLDDDDDGDLLDTADEDYNNNGDPKDDDTNNNNIPDFLESGVTLSVFSQEFENLTLYPNPVITSTVIQAQNLKGTLSVQVFDIQGKQVFVDDMLVVDSKITLMLDAIPQGVYFLRVFNEQNSSVIELIKK